jgi:type 1 glutamine amidotransferase
MFSLAAVFGMLVLSAANAPTEEATLPEELRVLVITGSHPFDPRFYGIFEQPGIAWDKKTQTSQPCAAFVPGFAEGYDVVLLYDFESRIDEAQKAAFRKAFGGGRGLVVLHHALCSHQMYWPEYREIIGGGYFFEEHDGHPKSMFTPNIPMTYVPAPEEHPVTQGLSPFTVVEEPYKNVYIVAGATPLLTAQNEHSDPVVAWTKMHGESRVVCIVPGHGPLIFENPEYRRFMAQALRWAGRK